MCGSGKVRGNLWHTGWWIHVCACIEEMIKVGRMRSITSQKRRKLSANIWDQHLGERDTQDEQKCFVTESVLGFGFWCRITWTASFWRGSRWWCNLESTVEDLEGKNRDTTKHVFEQIHGYVTFMLRLRYVMVMFHPWGEHVASFCFNFETCRVTNIIETLSTYAQIRQFSSNCSRFESSLAPNGCD